MYSLRYLLSASLSVLILSTFIVSCSRDDATPMQSGQLRLRSLTATVEGTTPPGFFNDWLTMSRIATIPEDQSQWDNLEVQDTATLRLTNASAEEPLYINDLLLDTAAFTFQRPELPVELAPNETLDLTVTFTEQEGEKGVRRGTLSVISSGGTSDVQLAGVFMQRPEGNSEVNLQQIVDAFGYTTDIGLEDNRLFGSAGVALGGVTRSARSFGSERTRASPSTSANSPHTTAAVMRRTSSNSSRVTVRVWVNFSTLRATRSRSYPLFQARQAPPR